MNKLLLMMLRFIRFFTIKKATIFMDNLYEDDVECIDTYSQFCFMKAQNKKVYYIIKKQNKLYMQLRKTQQSDRIIAVDDSSQILKKAFIPLCFTKNIVSAFCNFNMKHPVKKLIADFFYEDKSLNYIYLNHGVTFLKKWILSYYSPKFYNQLVVSNQYEKDIYITEANWKEANLINCGLPRWGNLIKKNHTQKSIFIFFTWRTSFNSSNYLQSMYYKRLKNLLTNNILREILHQYNIKLNIALHHAFYAKKIFFEELNEYTSIVDSCDVSSYISKTDLFITDYSSIAFDFMFLNIPVIFYKLDWDDVALNKDDKESMYYAMTKDNLLYNCVYYEEDLLDLIIHYIKHDFILEDKNKKINEKFFFCKDSIQQNLANILEK